MDNIKLIIQILAAVFGCLAALMSILLFLPLRCLVKEKVPTVMHILPQTDHAFDHILPKISPSAHNAFYDMERFLALIETINEESGNRKN